MALFLSKLFFRGSKRGWASLIDSTLFLKDSQNPEFVDTYQPKKFQKCSLFDKNVIGLWDQGGYNGSNFKIQQILDIHETYITITHRTVMMAAGSGQIIQFLRTKIVILTL